MDLQVAVVITEFSTSINFRVFEFHEDFHSQVFHFAIFFTMTKNVKLSTSQAHPTLPISKPRPAVPVCVGLPEAGPNCLTTLHK